MTREEQYLAKMIGEDIETPEPILRKEQYLSAIGNGSGEIPELPVTREERYLAILAGENYEIPTPETRLEQYMAKACGLEIEIPTPITRVKQLWAKIAEAGGWKVTEITGELPLMFRSDGSALVDYRIYGTSAGAGVETENLWDGEFEQGTIITGSGEIYSSNNRIRFADFFSLDSGTYTFSASGVVSALVFVYDATTGQNYKNEGSPYWIMLPLTFTVTSNRKIKIVCRISDSDVVYPSDITNIMLVPGSTAPSTYIPHGYKLPLTVESGETENIIDPAMLEEFPHTNISSQNKWSSYEGEASVWRYPCQPNMQYTICMINFSTSLWRISTINSDNFPVSGSVVSVTDIVKESGYSVTTFTTGSATRYILIQVSSNDNDQIPEKLMLVKGSTPPDHYIPHRYSSDVPIYIGSSKLGEEEYVDYESGKVYKRTANLFDYTAKNINNGYIPNSYIYPNGNVATNINWNVSEYIEVKPSETYTCAYVSETTAHAVVGFYDENKSLVGQSTIFNVDSVTTFVTTATTKYVRISYRTDHQSTAMLTEGSTPPETHIPYLQPTDPPVPLPPIPTYKGENTLSSTETLGEVTVKGRIKEAVPNG